MNDYFRYTQNLLPGGIARSQPITQSFDAINRAFDLLPNPITDGKTRGFSQPLPIAPGQESTDAVTLGQMLTAIADQADINVDVAAVQQAVDDAINANASAQSATQAAQGILTYLLEHQETAPLLGLAIGAVNINTDGELLITVKNPDQAIAVETLSPGQLADAEVMQDGDSPSYLLLRIPKGDKGEVGDVTPEATQARDDAQAARDQSQSAQAASEAARDQSQEWAEKPENTEVQPGAYSAYHWAKKAEQSAGTNVSWSQVTSKPTEFNPEAHTHPWSEVTGKPSEATRWPTFTEVTSKPNTYPPSSHSHTLVEITDSGTAASHNVPATGNAATSEVVKGDDSRLSDARTPTSHGHAISEVTSLQSSLDAKRALTDTAFPRYDLASTSTTATLDLSQQQVFNISATSNRTLSFSNPPSAGRAMTAVVNVTGSTGTITWPAGIDWSNGTAPDLMLSWTVVVLFWDGSNWRGFVSGGAD